MKDGSKTCAICGKPRKKNYFGIEISWQRYHEWGDARLPMCNKCARDVIPEVLQILKIKWGEGDSH